MTQELSRVDRAVLALHDYGTREGATGKKIFNQMLKDGFTKAEIVNAVKRMA